MNPSIIQFAPKYPKSLFYGGSESHCYRVALRVCQKNLGYDYIVQVNVMLNVSPRKQTQSSRKRKQNQSDRVSAQEKEIHIKIRRLQIKKETSCKNIAIAYREGVAYQSGCGYLNTSDLIDEVAIAGMINFI